MHESGVSECVSVKVCAVGCAVVCEEVVRSHLPGVNPVWCEGVNDVATLWSKGWVKTEAARHSMAQHSMTVMAQDIKSVRLRKTSDKSA